MLTKEQEEEAIRLYIESKLTPEEKEHSEKLQEARAAMQEAELAFEALQKACSHPLIAREHVNDGYSGNYDRDSRYWTSHKCKLCDLRWSTGQRWKHVGGHMGLPDDEAAKEE